MIPSEVLREFEDAMRSRNLVPPSGGVIPDGKVHRCDTASGRNGKGDGAYRLYDDEPFCGWIENHQDGLGLQIWTSERRERLSDAEYLRRREEWEQRKKARAAQEAKERQDAIEYAQKLWSEAAPAPADHPYLKRKGILPHDLRVTKDKVLLVPMQDSSGVISNLQRIFPGGDKRFLKAAPVKGTFYYLGPDPPGDVLVIAEGPATALSIYESTGLPVVAAMNAGNLQDVGEAIRKQLPDARLIYFADHDESGVGYQKAVEAARATIGTVAMSPTVKEDANDVYVRGGSKAVREILDAAAPPPSPVLAVVDTPEATQAMPKVDPLTFPAEVMSGAAGYFAQLYAQYLEPPTHFFFLSYLTCLGSIVADRLTILSELSPQPRLYVLLLGESGDDRKSTAISKVIEFFKMLIPEFEVCWGVGSAEGLQGKMEKSPVLLLALDEFRQFVSKSKIEASVLLPCVTTLFESNRYESHTKQSAVLLERAYLSMLAASTTATYENTWSSQFTDIGFNNRLWLVPGGASRRFSIPKRIPDDERYEATRMLKKVLAHINDHPRLDITEEGRVLYHKWYIALPRSIYAKRLDTYALRLMPLLAANDLKLQVDAETVRRVLALCDHQFQVRQLLDPVDADTECAKMEIKIRRVLHARGHLSDRDLKRYVNANKRGLWLYDQAKSNLRKAGELTHGKDGKWVIVGDVE